MGNISILPCVLTPPWKIAVLKPDSYSFLVIQIAKVYIHERNVGSSTHFHIPAFFIQFGLVIIRTATVKILM